jgi:hypothetical protein
LSEANYGSLGKYDDKKDTYTNGIEIQDCLIPELKLFLIEKYRELLDNKRSEIGSIQINKD